MKVDDMIRQARGTVDNVTELAARVGAMERERVAERSALEDSMARLIATLRLEQGMKEPLDGIATAVEELVARRRALEAGINHVATTLTEPRFPDTAIREALIELNHMLGKDDA